MWWHFLFRPLKFIDEVKYCFHCRAPVLTHILQSLCWQLCFLCYAFFCNSLIFLSIGSLFLLDVIHLGSRLPKLLFATCCPFRSLNIASTCACKKLRCAMLYAHKVCASKSVCNH